MANTDGIFTPPTPINEPVLSYIPGSDEYIELHQEIEAQSKHPLEIKSVIDGERITTDKRESVLNPSSHREVIGTTHLVGSREVNQAFDAAASAHAEWSSWGWEERAAVFLRAAALLAGPWRARINASTMLGQGKTAHQAEIDASCELIDFWKFNVEFAKNIYCEQPISGPGIWNRSDHRPLEGVIAAISPFNFSSIAANLPSAPALMGNTVVWKPSNTQAHSAYLLMELMEEAGLPNGVINLVFCDGPEFGETIMKRADLAGIHFTGSTATFKHLWREVANNLDTFRTYPRLVGETGGKDFIVAHPSADPRQLAVAITRGGFEYQGQKCSAASRIYLPSNLAEDTLDIAREMMAEMKMGDVRDHKNFIGPVIDKRSFDKIASYVDLGRETGEVIAGGGYDDSTGYFIEPTLVRVDDPHHKLMEEEIFGPVVTVYVYPEGEFSETLKVVDSTSPYALTGAIFSKDRAAVQEAQDTLRYAAGNFYINDKPTGAVVGQQPFGGSRASGTNDKAGSALNLLRWVSPRSIKENLATPTEWRYPFLG